PSHPSHSISHQSIRLPHQSQTALSFEDLAGYGSRFMACGTVAAGSIFLSPRRLIRLLFINSLISSFSFHHLIPFISPCSIHSCMYRIPSGHLLSLRDHWRCPFVEGRWGRSHIGMDCRSFSGPISTVDIMTI
ncbi:hypothetical protein PENTCL1PPCAC_11797, partial [Pristionchus entomophagus]